MPYVIIDRAYSLRTLACRLPALLAFLGIMCALGCGEDPDDGGFLGRTIFVDAAVERGGTGTVGDPTSSLAEALAVDLKGEGEITLILADGVYDVPPTLGAVEPMRWVGGTTPGTTLQLGGATLDVAELNLERLTLSGDGGHVGASARLLDVALVEGDTTWDAGSTEFNRVSIADANASLTGDTVTVFDALMERGTIALDGVANLRVDGLDATEGQGPLLAITDSIGVLNDMRMVDAGFISGEPTDVAADDRVGSALVIAASELALQDIVVERPLLRGLLAAGSLLEISDSEFRGGSRAAVSLVPDERGLGEYALTRVEVADATILLFSPGAAVSVADSFFSGGGTAGILASGGADLHIVSSTFLDCPNGHISLLGDTSQLTLEGNVIRGAANESCVSISSTTAPIIISQNTISSCAGSGVATLGVVDALIEGNDVSAITPSPLSPDVQEGISLVQSVATIRDNAVHDFGGIGIALLDSGGTIEGNQCTDLGGAGIRAVERGGVPLTSSNNRILRANVAGIFLFNVEGSSTGDEISDTRFDVEFGSGTGIAVSGPTSFSIDNASITGSSQHGVYVDAETAVTLTNSTIASSIGFAIACAGGASLTTDANTYTNNLIGDEDPRCFSE
ncbi:MAG: hypothetical protein ACI81R_001237 [Bradymonadia bacterium]